MEYLGRIIMGRMIFLSSGMVDHFSASKSFCLTQ